MYIYSFLSPGQLCHAARVCRQFKACIYDTGLWRELYHQRWRMSYRVISPSANWKLVFQQRATSQFNMRGNTFDLVSVGRSQNMFGGASGYCLQLLPNSDRALVGYRDTQIKEFDVTTGAETRLLKGHTAPVVSMCARQTSLVSGDSSGTLILWDLSKASCALPWNRTSYELTGRLRGAAEEVSQVYLDDAPVTRLMSAGSDGEITLFDLARPDAPATFQGHQAPVTFFAV
jgi:WD40 repeat protein